MAARILVVDYSRTGTTKRVATEIATILEADREAIVNRTERFGLIGYSHCAFEGWFQRLTVIARPVHDLSQYDLVVVGTPIWCLSLSSPVRTFLHEHRDALKAVAFFSTCDGHGSERVLRQMTREARKDPVATLLLPKEDLAQGLATPAIRRFAHEIRQALGIDSTHVRPISLVPPMLQRSAWSR